ncbi:tyrosine-type recombinase/integrase [Methylocystis parvus]|uniref:tyrosine-type recombinase/integrase n=1 Tax=Methylocystis parvus TaxID=134 RepID=UPI003C7722DC
MVRIRVPYYRVVRGNGFWQPTREMRAAGLEALACGPDGPEAWRKAQARNKEWQAIKAKARAKPSMPLAPRGSLDEAFRRYRATGEWSLKADRTREEWDRAWAHIGPIFGPMPPAAVTLEMISAFRLRVERKVSRREAHRVVKIWRALWRVAAALGYCERHADPSLGVRNLEPARRQALWTHAEARRLVKTAWRAGYRGLAAVIAVAWDSSLSPVDARGLTPAQRARDGQGDVFDVSRAKTGRSAIATLSRPASRILDAYLEGLGAAIAPTAPIFRNRSGRPYSKDTLGDDFRSVRALAFGPSERRTLADFRRSGAVEALRGGAGAEEIGTKLANDFASSANLQKTYAPVDLETVRKVDEARKRGRLRKR